MQKTCDIDTAGPLPAGVARETMAVQRSKAFCWSVRAGFVTRGVTYAIIGGLSAALAIGFHTTGTSPNQQGALGLIAQAPFGRVLLVVAAAGLLAYALWKISLAVIGRGPEGGGGKTLKDRVANLSAGGVYLVFFAVAVQVVVGSAGADGGERSQAAGVLSWPGGQFIVGIAGAVLAAVSLYQVYEAVRGHFIDDNKAHEMSTLGERVFIALGGVGLVARAAVFALVGYFLCRTAIEFKTTGIGLDGTLAQVHGQPLGNWMLAFVALGLEMFAAFSFFEARYQRL